MEIYELTTIELLEAYKNQTLSPREVIKNTFKRIEAINPQLNAFVTLNDEEAIKAAEKAERAIKDHEWKPLLGIPIAIKDLTNTKGIRTTYGCPLYKNHIPDRDATIVSRLKQAGAIIIGKTNTPEFGHKASTDNPLFGPSKNPWDSTLTTGGSSGGAAAAVAAGLVPMAEGSDGGGSIRIPSSFCGIFGFKPTYGRIPYDNHLNGVFGTHEPFLHHGPLTRTVTDAALMLEVTQGYSHTDPFSLPIMEHSILSKVRKGNRDLKIGFTMDFNMYEIDHEVRKHIDTALQNLRALGFQVEEINIDFGMSLDDYIQFFESLWTVGLASGCAPLADKHPDAFSSSILEMIERGKTMSAVDFKNLETTRARLWHIMQQHFQHYDLILSPTLAVTAFDVQRDGPSHINQHKIREGSDWVMTQIYNITGHPAASLPIGFDKKGLPVGLQIAGGRLEDAKVLQLAHTYESHFPQRTIAPLTV